MTDRAGRPRRTSEPRGTHNKSRILRMLRYFYRETDDQHKVTTNELVELASEWDTHANRKTVRDDIDALIDGGCDIVTTRSYYHSFFMASREFELPELKILIDAVSASQFITPKKTRQLIEKLSTLCSRYQAETLVRHIYTPDDRKPKNEDIYYIVNSLNDAVSAGKKVRFQYYDYTPQKEKVLRHGGARYVISPSLLIWDNNFYYLIGWSDLREKIVHFRVDRMKNVVMTEEGAQPAPPDFDAASYAAKLFAMYEEGEPEEVTLECENELMKTMIDRFGEDVTTRKWSSHSFRLKAPVYPSPTFFGWVFQFGGKVRIIGPEDVVEKYQTMLWNAMQAER